jgi:hypothetical protein
MSNIPTKSAFSLEVYSPLSATVDNEETKEWTYRIRKFTSYTGAEWVQSCHSTNDPAVWEYGIWYKSLRHNHFAFKSNYTSGNELGYAQYDNNGKSTFYRWYLPPASADTLGGVKLELDGTTLKITTE